MMWNIPKNTQNLEEKIYDKIQNSGNSEENYKFFELYPYKIFDAGKYPQYFNRHATDNFNENFEENFKKQIMDRQVEIKMNVYQLSKEENKDLNKAYFKYSKSDLSKFYTEVFKIIGDKSGNFKEKETI